MSFCDPFERIGADSPPEHSSRDRGYSELLDEDCPFDGTRGILVE